jgi:hypothetical protein
VRNGALHKEEEEFSQKGSKVSFAEIQRLKLFPSCNPYADYCTEGEIWRHRSVHLVTGQPKDPLF